MSQTPPSRDTTSLSEEKEKDLEYQGGAQYTSVLTAGLASVNDGAGGSNGPETQEDDKETHRIMRKIDWRILPICSLLYLFSFLDRTAIGNAKVAGMDKELRLTATEYALALSLFFIPYGLLEVPSNVMLKRFGAKRWLPAIVISWGIVMTLTGVVQNAKGLIAARIFLGGTEAGLFPGVSVLLSFLYPRSFIQLRIGVFFSAATVAGAFGGLLAYGLTSVRTGGYSGWRWLFIVEGILTVAVGVLGYFMLVSNFNEAKFLTPQEKQYMQDRIQYDGVVIPMNNSFQWKFVWDGLLDWKTWLALFAYIGSLTPLYSIALTLPTILKTTLGYSAVEAQYMTIPVYVVAAICVIIFAFLSDKTKNRSAFLIIGCTISAIGWIIGLAVDNARVRYGAVFLSAAGSYAGFPSIVALVSQNVGGQTKRSVSLAILVGIGGLCGIISSNIFLASEVPKYVTGYKINIGLNCLAIAGTALKAALLLHANKRKQRMIDSGEAAKLTRQQLADMGDRSPYFVYRI